MTQCNPRKYEFQGIKGRLVEGGFDGGRISSDGGALLLRELIEQRGYIRSFAKCFEDYRREELIEHTLEALLGQRVLGLCLGYEDLNDHDELRKDPLLSILSGESDVKGNRGADSGRSVFIASIQKDCLRPRSGRVVFCRGIPGLAFGATARNRT